MPIRPENKARYPANWKEIREKILERAKNRCEECAVENHAIGYRYNGEFIPCAVNGLVPRGMTIFKIVLTIAHLDHVPENCDPANLRAWCQRCHNRYDNPVRRANRKRRLERERSNSSLPDTPAPGSREPR